jgi:hypothetical protein
MDNSQAWRTCFTNWPEEIPRRGINIEGQTGGLSNTVEIAVE